MDNDKPVHPLKLFLAFSAAFAIIIWGIYAEPEPDPMLTEYCPMWSIWHADRLSGVPIEKRNGYPDINHMYYQECQTSEETEPNDGQGV